MSGHGEQGEEPRDGEHEGGHAKQQGGQAGGPRRKGAPLPTRAQKLTVRIEALDDEGRGRGLLSPDADDDVRVDVAVRGAFPGDFVEMTVERTFPARRLAVGRLVRLLEEGPLRVSRTCSHPPPCVGCPLDGLDPSVQVALKRERIARALADADIAAPEIDDVLSAPSLTGYRQKVKLVAGGRAGAIKLGLYAPYSHFVVDASRCATHHPSLTPALAALKDALNAAHVDPHAHDPSGLKAVVARAFREGVGAVVVTGGPLEDDAWLRLRDLVDSGQLASISERVDDSRGNSVVGGSITRHVGPERLTPLDGALPTTVDAFAQPDPVQARVLYGLVADLLADGGHRLLDAYAGTGGFSRAFIERVPGAEVSAVESSPHSLEALAELGVALHASDVASALPSLPAGAFDAVVADPPRKGLGADAEGLAALGARRFVLVSCDPDAMARDVRVLVDAGYRIVRVLPVDLFAGTPEVETVTLLERSAS